MVTSTERAAFAGGGLRGDAMRSAARLGLHLASLAVLALASAASAQPNAVHKTTLQDTPFPPPGYHTATVRTVVDPGGEVAPHTHPGIEMGYVLQGQATLNVRGRTARSLAAGESFSIPPRTVHSVRNAGRGALTMLSTYVVEKGQPIASPAP
jgi:quercetin dioxygenase-like cupin family protein